MHCIRCGAQAISLQVEPEPDWHLVVKCGKCGWMADLVNIRGNSADLFMGNGLKRRREVKAKSKA
jgi:hypothetical protein